MRKGNSILFRTTSSSAVNAVRYDVLERTDTGIEFLLAASQPAVTQVGLQTSIIDFPNRLFLYLDVYAPAVNAVAQPIAQTDFDFSSIFIGYVDIPANGTQTSYNLDRITDFGRFRELTEHLESLRPHSIDIGDYGISGQPGIRPIGLTASDLSAISATSASAITVTADKQLTDLQLADTTEANFVALLFPVIRQSPAAWLCPSNPLTATKGQATMEGSFIVSGLPYLETNDSMWLMFSGPLVNSKHRFIRVNPNTGAAQMGWCPAFTVGGTKNVTLETSDIGASVSSKNITVNTPAVLAQYTSADYAAVAMVKPSRWLFRYRYNFSTYELAVQFG